MVVKVNEEECTGCESCIDACPIEAIEMKDGIAKIKDNCNSCNACIESCPVEAILEVEKEEKAEVIDFSQYKDVWVFAEQRGGELKRVAYQLTGGGRALADALGQQLCAMLLGNDVKKLAQELIAYGADKVYVAEDEKLNNYQTDAYASVICNMIKELKPNIVIYGATHIGRDLAPRIAQRLDLGLTADCTELTIDPEEQILLQTRPAFGGNIMATIITPGTRPQMATVRPGIMKELEKDEKRKGEIVDFPVKLSDAEIKTKILEIVKEAKKRVNLEEANIIVSGGRGVGSKEGFNIIRELARALKGEVGGSRVAVEKGWIEQDHQVGQTGKTVRPRLYIACGISGSIQHRAGMQNSEIIVAVNKDPDATIFKIAHYGIVGDLHEVVPLLVEEFKKIGD
ncbi:MAG: FAD-binding protein [Methanomassiliicoccales archaeon]|nr:MAG: FAD-binding protein [Methanomassiliicoccales archaeon]